MQVKKTILVLCLVDTDRLGKRKFRQKRQTDTLVAVVPPTEILRGIRKHGRSIAVRPPRKCESPGESATTGIAGIPRKRAGFQPVRMAQYLEIAGQLLFDE